jgi:hypothetical protein
MTTVDVLPSGALYAVELNGRHMTIPDPMGRADRTMTVTYLQLRCEVLSAQRLNGDPAGELLAHIAGWNHD